jgi:hypothetical protein
MLVAKTTTAWKTTSRRNEQFIMPGSAPPPAPAVAHHAARAHVDAKVRSMQQWSAEHIECRDIDGFNAEE